MGSYEQMMSSSPRRTGSGTPCPTCSARAAHEELLRREGLLGRQTLGRTSAWAVARLQRCQHALAALGRVAAANLTFLFVEAARPLSKV